jgi:hypothetical protein
VHRPKYFQVQQIPVAGTNIIGAKAGTPLSSNIVGGIGKAVLKCVGGVDVKGIVAKGNSDGPWPRGDWYEFEVTLSLDDQYYDAFGADFTVTAGDWVVHFYSGHMEGTTYCGPSSFLYPPGRPATGAADTLRYAAPAVIRVPWHGKGVVVKVSAKGDGLAAEGSFTLPNDPQIQADAQKNGAVTRTALAGQVRQTEDFLKSDDENLKKLDAKSGFDAEATAIQAHGTHDWNAQYVLPKAQNDLQRADAVTAGNDAAYLATYVAELSLAKKNFDLQLATVNALVDHDQKGAGDSSLPQYTRDAIAREIADAPQTRKGYADNADAAVAAVRRTMLPIALRAGNRDVYTSLMQEQIRAANVRADRSTVAAIYRDGADDLAILGADRQACAKMLLSGHAIEYQAADTAARGQVQQRWESSTLPAWWPVGLAVPAKLSGIQADGG